ncbi:MAG: hypothetical protein O6758_00335 [Planctomycetota bacterium]|nr:hypothetical protein [Planctomycetota bacterium]
MSQHEVYEHRLQVTTEGGGGNGGTGNSDNGSGNDPSLNAALAQMGFDSVGAYQAWVIAASDSEAFASASLVLALLEAQP